MELPLLLHCSSCTMHDADMASHAQSNAGREAVPGVRVTPRSDLFMAKKLLSLALPLPAALHADQSPKRRRLTSRAISGSMSPVR